MTPIYEFGTFRLDPAERLLLRDGQPVSLTRGEERLFLDEVAVALDEVDEQIERVRAPKGRRRN